MQATIRCFALVALLAGLANCLAPSRCFGEEQAPASESEAKEGGGSAPEPDTEPSATKPCDAKQCDAKLCHAKSCDAKPCDASGEQDDDGYSFVRKKLDSFVTLNCKGKPFYELIDELAKLLGVDIVVNGIDSKYSGAPVNLHLGHCRAKVALKQALHQIDDELCFAVRDGFLLIASRERMDSIHEARVYRHGQLPPVTRGMPAGGYGNESPAVAEFQQLMSVIEPQSWETSGGQGRLAYVNGNLVVWQSPRIHDQIADLLENLRRADEQGMRDFEKAGKTATSPGHAPVGPYAPVAPVVPAPPQSVKPAGHQTQPALPLPIGPARLH